MRLANLPTGSKIVGGNVAQTYSDWALGSQKPNLQFWTNNWDFGWVKNSIDYGCGNGLGLNCIRIQGSPDAIGTITQATYNARWQQICDYAGQLGVYVYPCGGWGVECGAMSDAAISANIISMLGALDGYPNVIGCDLLQEANQTFKLTPARIRTIYNDVKATTDFPLTYSTSLTMSNTGGDTAWEWLITILGVDYLDYFDFHCYSPRYNLNNPIPSSFFNQWISAYPTRDIILGEFGIDTTNTAPQQSNYLQKVCEAAADVRAQIRGCLIWNIVAEEPGDPFPPSAEGDFGIYDRDFGFYTAKSVPMKAATGGRAALRPVLTPAAVGFMGSA